MIDSIYSIAVASGHVLAYKVNKLTDNNNVTTKKALLRLPLFARALEHYMLITHPVCGGGDGMGAGAGGRGVGPEERHGEEETRLHFQSIA